MKEEKREKKMEMDDQPRSLKDVLKEMKDTSEFMIDLAYSSLLYNDRDIATEVLKLEEKMDSLLYNARISAILAARRDVDEAREISAVLQIVASAEKISDAAGDIAKITLLGIPIPEELRSDFMHAEETVVRLKVEPNSKIAGKTLEKLDLESKTGMRVIAIRRGMDWIFDPPADTRLLREDIIFARGPDESIPVIYEMSTSRKYEGKGYVPTRKVDALEKAVDLVVEMKNVSELAVGLAYSSVLFNDLEIAQEVQMLEEKMDRMHHELELLTLRAAREVDPESLSGLLHLSSAAESISDAAYGISDIVLRNMSPHPIFAIAVRESDEIITKIFVEKNAKIVGRKIGEIGLETEIIAIRRVDKWMYSPKDDVVIQAGDILIAKGTRAEEKLLLSMCRG